MGSKVWNNISRCRPVSLQSRLLEARSSNLLCDDAAIKRTSLLVRPRALLAARRVYYAVRTVHIKGDTSHRQDKKQVDRDVRASLCVVST